MYFTSGPDVPSADDAPGEPAAAGNGENGALIRSECGLDLAAYEL